MGLSFHDEESMEAATTLLFQVQASSDESDNSNSISLGSGAVRDSEESNDDDVIDTGLQQGKDIDKDTHDYNSTVQV